MRDCGWKVRWKMEGGNHRLGLVGMVSLFGFMFLFNDHCPAGA